MTDSEKRAYDAALKKCIDELAADPHYLRDYDQDDIYDEGRKIRNRHIDEFIRKSLKDAGVFQFYEPFGANSRVKNELSRRWVKMNREKWAAKEEKRRQAIEEEEEAFHKLIHKEKAEEEQRSSTQSRIHDGWMWVAAGGGSWFPGSIPDEFKMSDRPASLEDEPWFP